MKLPVAALHHAAASVPDWYVTASGHSAGQVVPVEVLTVPFGMGFAVESTVALDENEMLDAQLDKAVCFALQLKKLCHGLCTGTLSSLA